MTDAKLAATINFMLVRMQLRAGGWGLGLSYTLRSWSVDLSEVNSSSLAAFELVSGRNPFLDPGALRYYVNAGAALPPTPFVERKVLAARVWYDMAQAFACLDS